MRKRWRSLKLGILILLVVAVAAVLGVDFFADSAVRMAIDRAGTKALKVPVDVDRASLSIFTGTLDIEDMTVDSPSGYDQKTLLDLSQGTIEVETKSLLTDEVLIRSVRLDGMNVFVEQKGLDNNLHEVIKALPRSEDASGKRVIVDHLEIADVTVHVKLLAIPGQPDTVTFKLATIQMDDLGRNERLDITMLVSKIVLAVATGIAEQGGGVLPKDMISGLSTVLDTAIDIGRTIFGNGQSGAEEIGRGITEGLKGIIKQKDE
jgi:uncharacterized protein involved in outer membrane biogenesis